MRGFPCLFTCTKQSAVLARASETRAFSHYCQRLYKTPWTHQYQDRLIDSCYSLIVERITRKSAVLEDAQISLHDSTY
jgi:hypothetical protein